MVINRTNGHFRQARYTLARRRLPILFGAIIAGLALITAPTSAQVDRCYEGLDCPDDMRDDDRDDIRRNAPPSASPPPQDRRRSYDERDYREREYQRPDPGYDEVTRPYEYPSEAFGLQASYSAMAYCSLTGAVGSANGAPTPKFALQAAISRCIARGGVPSCCLSGSRLTQ